MSSKLNPRAIPQRPLPPGSGGGHANKSNVQLPKIPEHPNPRLVDNKPANPACRFSPFDEHLNILDKIPQWQADLDDHFTNVFRPSVLSRHAIDDMVAPALRIIGRPTRLRIRVLARTVYMHWLRIQVRSRNTKILVREIIGLITGISSRLGFLAREDFLDELGLLCIEKLKLTLRWYVDARFHQMLGMPRQNLFMRVMAVVVMISHLFNSGQFRSSAVLNSLMHVAAMPPWPDAIAVMYALLHGLGPKFAQEQHGWGFILDLLARLKPLTKNWLPADPVHQLVSAITTLVEGWCNTTFTPYHTHPGVRIGY